MRKFYTIVIICCSLLFSGCNEATIDATNEITLKESTQKVKNSLPEEKQELFMDSLNLIMFSQINLGELLQKNMLNEEVDSSFILNKAKILHNKNALEIIELAKEIKVKEDIKEKKEQEERTELIKEIDLKEFKKLKDLENLYLKGLEYSNKIKIHNAKIYKQNNSYIEETVLEFEIENLSDISISRIFLNGILKSPNRKVPWFNEDFNYIISGGIEPNEKLKVTLTPNMFNKINSIKIPADYIFEIITLGAEDHENNKIFELNDFTQKEKDRLKELSEQYKK